MPFLDSQSRLRELEAQGPATYYEEPEWGDVFRASFNYVVDEELSISSLLNNQGVEQRREQTRSMLDDGVIQINDYVNSRGRFDYSKLSDDMNNGVLSQDIVDKYGVIKTDAQIQEERNQTLAIRRAESERLRERGSGTAQFLGMLSGYMLDPINLATLPLSTIVTAGKGLSVAAQAFRTAKMETGLSVGAEALIQPFVYAHKNDIDSPYSSQDAIANIGFAAVGGALLGGASGGISGYFRRIREVAEEEQVQLANQIIERFREEEELIEAARAARGGTVSEIVEREYQAFIQAVADGKVEEIGPGLRDKTIAALEARAKELGVDKKTFSAWLKENGGLNMEAWKGEIEPEYMTAKVFEVAVWRKNGGMTPEDLAEKLFEDPVIKPGWVFRADRPTEYGANDAIDWLQDVVRNPKGEYNPEIAQELDRIQAQIDELKDADVDALEAIYNREMRSRVAEDQEILQIKEDSMRRANQPTRIPKNFEEPERPKPEAMTVSAREREFLVNNGIDEAYDRDMEIYRRLATDDRNLINDNGEIVNADEYINLLDDDIRALDDVIRCTISA